MKISVVLPTFRRPSDLARCLGALQAQLRKADEILVIARPDDLATLDVLRQADAKLKLRCLSVYRPGVVAALNAGLSGVSGDIIAITDDDTAPRPDWLERIERWYQADESVGGVGGRDFIHRPETTEDLPKQQVGTIQWFGRRTGNHHLGVGAARYVEMIKGANMSFRRKAIEHLHFDERLKGGGAQVHLEVQFCLAVRRRGWRIIYDPAIAVDHYLGMRHDNDRRDQFNFRALSDAVHNETLALLEHLPSIRRSAFMVWAICVGQRGAPGVLQWFRFILDRDQNACCRVLAALKGRWDGWRTWRLSQR
jgi:glycosyltransferase involved in cell wall biosynthesis